MPLRVFEFNDIGNFDCFVELEDENSLQPWRASKYINDEELVSYGETPDIAALRLCGLLKGETT